MNSLPLLATGLLFAATLSAADPKEDIKAAAKNLADKPNYSWTTRSEIPGSQFTIGPTTGKAEKGGFALVTQEMNDRTSQAVLKGTNGVVKTDEGWQTAAELPAPGGGGGGGRGGMMGRLLLNTRLPAVDAEGLVAKVKELKAGDGGAMSGDLTEDGAKELLTFGRRGRGGQGGQTPAGPKNAKGSVKFWVKDGVLAKYETRVSGTVTFGGEERDMERISTVEIKDIGTTKVEVPDEAKKKLSP